MKINRYLLVFVLTCVSFFADAQQISLESAAQLVQSGSAGDCDVRASCYDPQGNVLITGHFSNTVDFDPGAGVSTMTAFGATGLVDIFILKLSASGTFIWVKKIGNSTTNMVGDMAVDASGNILLTGILYQTVDFDPGPGTFNLTSDVGWDNAFLAKLTSAGDFVWAKKTSGANGDAGGNQLAFDTAGNILVGGKFWGTEDFDMSNATYNVTAVGSQAFVMKVTPAGAFMWVKCFGENGNVFPISEMLVDENDDIILYGSVEETSDFDPGPGTYIIAPNYENTYILRLDVNGGFLWAGTMECLQGARAGDMKLDQQGNIVMAVYFFNSIDVDPTAGVFTLSTPSTTGCGLVKISGSGDFIWGKAVGSVGTINLDASGNSYVSGGFGGTQDFDPGPGIYNLSNAGTGADLCMYKLDVNGHFRWAVKGGETTGYDAFATAIPASGNTWLTTGYFVGSSDIDLGPGTYNINGMNEDNIFLATYSECETDTLITASACEEYILNGQTYTATGTYIQVIPNTAGCDSLITLQFTRLSEEQVFQVIACDSFVFGGITYTTEGTYTSVYTNMAGCDSTLTLHLTFGGPSQAVLTETACGSYTLNGTTYTASGSYTSVIPNYAGCDSTITLNLTVLQPTQSTLTVTACGDYTLNGMTYSTSGTYTSVIPNAAGCDSTITLNLTVLQETSSVLTVSSCDDYVFNGVTYGSSGTYLQTLMNAAGCDSTITLHLTITGPTESFLNETACGSYTLNGTNYTASGIYTAFLQNAQGCDSSVTLYLTIVQPSQSVISETACGSYDLNGSIYTSSGTYTSVIPNYVGCDSTITLNLTLLQPSQSTLTETACSSYELNGDTYTASGTYISVIPNAAGCDSTITLVLTITESTTGFETVSAYGEYTWPVNNNTYTVSGSYTHVLVNAAGCDSLITLTLEILPDLPLTVSTYCMPSDVNDCTGSVQIDIAGDTDFSADIDGTGAVTTSGSLSADELCPGIHSLFTTDASGDTLTTLFVIPADTNFLFNNPVPDSTVLDSLGMTTENCTIDYQEIDSAYIVDVLANGNMITVTWEVFYNDTSSLETAVYEIANGNGIYYLQLSLYCLQKETGNYFTVTQSINWTDGVPGVLGMDLQAAFDLAIYPNPVFDGATVTFPAPQGIITVYDVSGKLIHTQAVKSGDLIAVDEFEAGVYFFNLGSAGNIAVQRVVKVSN